MSISGDRYLVVANEMRNIRKKYQSNPEDVKEVYRLINTYYIQKNLYNNYESAYASILKTFNYEIGNPFLQSALYYFKGDLEILMGRYNKAEKSLQKAIELHPGNYDPIQRLCEMEFLKGKPLQAIEKVENEYPHARNFWGLGRGHLLFKSFCYIQAGKFAKAGVFYPQIVDRTHQESVKCFEGMTDIFKGNYQGALANLTIFETKFVSILTVLELRLLTSRARILAEAGLSRAQFYLEDILEFSRTKKHLAAISAAYLRAKSGSTAKAEDMARSAFNKLLQLSKGDFESRLWLFYDAYIYGKTMELCGNKKEAVRGYRECINANPHTGLARESRVSLQRLEER